MTNTTRTLSRIVAITAAGLLGLLLVIGNASAQAPAGQAAQPAGVAGLWDAVVVVNDVEVPFRFEIGGSADAPTGAFFDGDQRVRSTSGSIRDGQIVLAFDQYGTTVEATLQDGALVGRYDRGTRGAAYALRARRAATEANDPAAPSIAGVWIVPTTSTKGEQAFRFIARQQGSQVSAAILRVDGDTGTLSGGYRDGRFLLSHFSGARPARYEVTLKDDGSLELLQNGSTRLTAVRASDPRAQALGKPSDPSEHTRVKDASVPLQVSAPSLGGGTVSLSDDRFRGKAVIVSVTGSWCPNCHDETPFLVELHRKYRARGLEVVALTFEEAAQLKNPTRVRAFVKQYGIEYPVLLVGETDELNAKLPQFENLNAFPTTFYLGRDGRVRYVHAGFPSPASGAFYTEAREDIERIVESLLAEPTPGAAR